MLLCFKPIINFLACVELKIYSIRVTQLESISTMTIYSPEAFSLLLWASKASFFSLSWSSQFLVLVFLSSLLTNQLKLYSGMVTIFYWHLLKLNSVHNTNFLTPLMFNWYQQVLHLWLFNPKHTLTSNKDFIFFIFV